MGHFTIHEPYQVDSPILRSVQNIESVQGITIESANVGISPNAKKTFPAGMFLAQVNGVNRFLPRTRVTTAVASGVNQLVVDHANVFRIGDVVQRLEQTATITVAGTWVVGDVVLVSYDKGSFSYTVDSTVAANIAQGIANVINAQNVSVAATVAGAVVTLSSVNGSYLTATTNSAAGTLTIVGYAAAGFIGTITAINYETRQLTFAANISGDVAQGALIGVGVNKVYGLYRNSVDFSDKGACILSAISGADGVYSRALPYLDSDLVARFPRINFV
jgi:hypothetical protein